MGKLMLVALLVSCWWPLNAEEYDVAQENTGWLVVDDDVIVQEARFYESSNIMPSLENANWSRAGELRKSSLLLSGSEYITFYDTFGNEITLPEVPNGYIYFENLCGYSEMPIYRVKENALKKVVVSDYIPLEYGDGTDYHAENGYSFKIVSFKHNNLVKGEYAERFRRYLDSNACYVLIVMSSVGEVVFVDLLEKTPNGFHSVRNYSVWNTYDMCVDSQGELLCDWEVHCGEGGSEPEMLIKWVVDENALVCGSPEDFSETFGGCYEGIMLPNYLKVESSIYPIVLVGNDCTIFILLGALVVAVILLCAVIGKQIKNKRQVVL